TLCLLHSSLLVLLMTN
ncbi:hypothetical protein VCHC17A1_4026B, partial [Vibrio cholerae HC-17A1]